MLKQKEFSKIFPVIGMICSVAITFTSASSGPIFTLFAGIFGLALWKVRHYLKIILISFPLFVIILDIIMKAEVWFIIARVPIVGGSTAWHRAYLIDRAIHHFSEWWLVGVSSSAHWGWGLQDVTNQFIRIGIDGGLLTLLLFISILVLCFRTLSKSMQFMAPFSYETQFFIWGMGVSLFAHIVSFMGVSYFDQIIVIWYLLLAMISGMYNFFLIPLKNITKKDDLILNTTK
jgi:hypothetical protein